MGNTISTAFIEEYDAAVKLGFQRQGSLLRHTVRNKNNVNATTAYFQKLGKGEASGKGRNGDVPVMNPEHTNVSFTLSDQYAADYVDKLDEQKINIDEKMALQQTGIYAIGRKCDSQIITALDTSTSYSGADTDGLTKDKIKEALFETLYANDVPDDGNVTSVIGWTQWSELLDIKEFANADYVGASELPWIGNSQAKRWMNVLWIPHSGLSVSSSVRKCHMFHKNAVGFGSGAEIKTEMNYVPTKAAHFVNSMMSMGACLIDTTGVVTLRCLES